MGAGPRTKSGRWRLEAVARAPSDPGQMKAKHRRPLVKIPDLRQPKPRRAPRPLNGGKEREHLASLGAVNLGGGGLWLTVGRALAPLKVPAVLTALFAASSTVKRRIICIFTYP